MCLFFHFFFSFFYIFLFIYFFFFGFGPQLRVRVSGCDSCVLCERVGVCARYQSCVTLRVFWFLRSRFQPHWSELISFVFFRSSRRSMCVVLVRRIVVTSAIDTSVCDWVCLVFSLFLKIFQISFLCLTFLDSSILVQNGVLCFFFYVFRCVGQKRNLFIYFRKLASPLIFHQSLKNSWFLEITIFSFIFTFFARISSSIILAN